MLHLSTIYNILWKILATTLAYISIQLLFLQKWNDVKVTTMRIFLPKLPLYAKYIHITMVEQRSHSLKGHIGNGAKFKINSICLLTGAIICMCANYIFLMALLKSHKKNLHTFRQVRTFTVLVSTIPKALLTFGAKSNHRKKSRFQRIFVSS